MIRHIPRAVFVPFEKVNGKWIKRDDLPRFKEPEEAMYYIFNNKHVCFCEGQPVLLQWQERDEPSLVHEYLRGVGTPEYLTLKH